MVLWFNDGNYVMKALDLKQRMGVLTGEEKEKYEQQFIPKLIPPEKAQEIRESKETAAADTEYEEARPVTDTIQVDDERDLSSAETLQEKISKGFRDIFGGHKKSEESEELEENTADEEKENEQDLNVSDSDTEEDTPEAEAAAAEETEKAEIEEDSEEASEEEPEIADGEEMLVSGIDNLSGGTVQLKTEELQDKEEEKAEKDQPDFSATMRMPELKIPKSMINVDPENASSAADIPDASGIFGNIDDIAASVGEKKDSDKGFNLEDTILAAATEQGIKIPKEDVTQDAQTAELHLLRKRMILTLQRIHLFRRSRMQQISRISWRRFPHSRKQIRKNIHLTVFRMLCLMRTKSLLQRRICRLQRLNFSMDRPECRSRTSQMQIWMKRMMDSMRSLLWN